MELISDNDAKLHYMLAYDEYMQVRLWGATPARSGISSPSPPPSPPGSGRLSPPTPSPPASPPPAGVNIQGILTPRSNSAPNASVKQLADEILANVGGSLSQAQRDYYTTASGIGTGLATIRNPDRSSTQRFVRLSGAEPKVRARQRQGDVSNDVEKVATHVYTTDDMYTPFNADHRGGRGDAKWPLFTRTLMNAVEHFAAPPADSCTLYRGQPALFDLEGAVKQLGNAVDVWNTFTSCSTALTSAVKFACAGVLLEIKGRMPRTCHGHIDH
eukprot:5440029-Prymnesium_polylepis.3